MGAPVSMSLRDADLVEVLRTFARLGDLNMILHPGIKGSVTVELNEVPWDQAMTMILKMHGLGMDITQGTLRVASPKALQKMIEDEARLPSQPAVVPTYRVRGELRHLDAGAMARLLSKPSQGYLTPRGRAVSDRHTNTLTVDDLRRRLEKVAKMVTALDVPDAASWDDKALENRGRRLVATSCGYRWLLAQSGGF